MKVTAITHKHLTPRGIAFTAVTAAAMILLTACGGSSGGDTAATSAAARATSSDKSDLTGAPVQLTADPCSLVTQAEAEDVIGTSVSPGRNGHICTYTANGNGGIVSVEEVAPDFCKLLFTALDQDRFGGDQVRIDVGQGGMQVKGGGNVQVVVAGGCLEIHASKDGKKVDDATTLGLAKTAVERVTAGADPTPSTVNSAPSSGSGTPSTKPCDLLTKTIAEDALGIPVGDPAQVPGAGNETCNYRARDTSVTAMVYLTTYAATGSEAVLDQAAAQFANAHPVDGVGDAARVSIEEHAIGVLKGDIVFGIGLILPGAGQGITPVTEAQMVKLADAVLDRI